MVDESVIVSVKNYLKELVRIGVPIHSGVLFGSQVHQSKDRWSDIDLIVISKSYDKSCRREDINLLWRTAARTDSRIEHIPVGLKRWQTDDTSTIIEVARREGIQISV